ncbi:MAG: protein-methionine-sulfoxide reductase heme-binding subunit MsrQ [Thiohalomonadales bacterium]|nr:protein-methionine-sulfoxide reductase heme-binding subunit MsrQ [Thiohalomonadales bacterium]
MTLTRLQLFKSVLFVLCLIPAVLLGWKFYHNQLGANPFEVLTRNSGEWTLRFLLLTLLMSPLRQILQQSWPLQLRRMLGLYSFFYASLHLMTYLWFDQFFDWQEIMTDIAERPFITVGITAWILLVPLAVTSTKGMMRRLGRRWKRLHRSIYVIACLGVLHFIWLVKADLREPLIYAAILIVLLGYRLAKWGQKHEFGIATR